MDFEKYFQKLEGFIKKMEASEEYDISYKIYPPSRDIEEFEKDIAAETNIDDFHVWEQFKTFYKVTKKITFRWGYRHNFGRNGRANIRFLYSLYQPEEQIGGTFNLYEGYRIFDYIGSEFMRDDDYVGVKFVEGKEEPDFYYYSLETESYYKMSIGFVEYLTLLLECRGLYPWQEFFIADKSYPKPYDILHQFLVDLEFLFPEADKSKFSNNLE